MRLTKRRQLGIVCIIAVFFIYVISLHNRLVESPIRPGAVVKDLAKRNWINFDIGKNGAYELDYSVDLEELRKRGREEIGKGNFRNDVNREALLKNQVGGEVKNEIHGEGVKQARENGENGEKNEENEERNGRTGEKKNKNEENFNKNKEKNNENEDHNDENEYEINFKTLELKQQQEIRDSHKSEPVDDSSLDHPQTEDPPPTIDPIQALNSESLQDKINFMLMDLKYKPNREILPTCSAPLQNFAYIKNHKCASDTLAAIFRRFGYARELTFVQPVRLFWNIGWPFLLKSHMYRALKSQQFNILTEHTVYDRMRLGKLMPEDAVYITSIREPFSRLQSAFPFFNYGFYSGIQEMVDASADPLEFFLLSNKTWFDETYKHSARNKVCVPQGLSTIRNFMSFELGLPVGFYGPEDRQEDLSYIKEWLQSIDDSFHMVMIVEYFSESMVMLKRMMCWTAKDILYRRLNTKRLHPPKPQYARSVVDNFLSWTFVDTLLYTHFNNTLWRRIHAMGSRDFFAEVQNFDDMREVSMKFCSYAVDYDVTKSRELLRDRMGQSKLSPMNATRNQSQPPNGDDVSVNQSERAAGRDDVIFNQSEDYYVIIDQSGARHELVFHETRWNPELRITREDCEMMFSESELRDEIRKRYEDDPTPVEQPLPPGDGRPWGC